MSTPGSRTARRARRQPRGRRDFLRFDHFEERCMLSTGGFIQGVVHDASNTAIQGAKVYLYTTGGTLVTQAGVTNPAVTDSGGYYAFDGVAPGTYDLVESATGYTAGVGNGDIYTTINPASVITTNQTTEIQVTVVDLSTNPSVSLQWLSDPYTPNPYETAGYELNVSSYNPLGYDDFVGTDTIGGFNDSLAGNQGNQSQFITFCSDIPDGVGGPPSPVYTVDVSLTPNSTTATTTADLGEIGYLYNTYGRTATPGYPGSSSGLTAAEEGAGLQLALWALEYNPSGSLNINDADTTQPFAVSSSTTSANIIAAANAYLAAAANKSQSLYFLNMPNPDGSGNGQGMLSTDLLDFTDTPQTSLGTPSINTQQQPASAVVGSSIADQATATGGSNPTGTVTFSLYNNPNGAGTPLFTDANEPLVGGVATSKGYTATATGTDYWVATYNGDSNNNPVTSGTSLEPVVISPASPSINTSQQPASATVGSSIADKATVTGGYNPTGTVTFNLYNNPDGTGTPLFTDANEPLVDGVAISKGYVAQATGTDYWVATYNGDANNNSVTGGTASEPVSITPATPAINTQQQPASATVGSSIADKATVSGGYNPTGTVTFSLYNNPNGAGTPLFTDANEPLVGGVATSKGYTATTTGTDYWVATYNGDSNNKSVSSGRADEPVVVSPVTPSIATTPGGTVTLGSFTIGGVKYLDATGDGFSRDDTPQAGITIDLYRDTNGSAGLQVGTGGDTLVATAKTASDGTYSFTLNTAGTYYVEEAVPSGYIQTGGGPNGVAGNTYYTIHAIAGQVYSGNNFDDYLMPNCCPSGVTFTVNNVNVGSSLSGKASPGATVSAIIPTGASGTFSLVAYTAPSPSFSTGNAYQQTIYKAATGTFAAGQGGKLTVALPSSYYQVDFVCGQPIGQLDPNQNGNAYGPDSAEVLYSPQGRLISSDNGGTTSPGTLTGQPATPPAPVTIASTALALTDSATLTGGSSPTGTITFYLLPPGSTSATPLAAAVYTDAVAVAGDGTYTTAAGDHAGGYVPSQAGTYQWVAVYGGDGSNGPATSPFGSEPETVNPAGPSITTSANPTTEVVCTGALKDTATLTGGNHPTGNIVFTLTSPAGCVVDTETVSVNGDGSYTTPKGYVPTQTGTYSWVATYSGDTNNQGVASGSHDEPVVATSASCPVGPNDFATIGYWHNQNGQKLIDELNNGGSTGSATSLGTWLANTFPELYGSGADSGNPYEKDLAGLSNAQVASFYLTLFGASGIYKTYAQVMAVALGSYATNAALAGGNYASQVSGFNMPSGGTGTHTYNVGPSGSALGLSNNTSYSVLDILAAANSLAGQGTATFNGKLGAVNAIFNGINTAGDISNSVGPAAPSGTVAFSPAQVRAAYGVSGLSLDGTGQTIAIVDAYDDPVIFQAVDTFDGQFGLTDSGPSLLDQYGAASSFLTVLSQSGQAGSLPATDPSGAGTDNWEVETALDVEWAHAMAPGARIVLVEANSQSLSDLMSAVSTAAAQPGVSVVSMSWGFTEGQAVFAADEARYDAVFNVPGVAFLASTGDYGVANPEYPAFSPDVVAVGGTSLNLNPDGSYGGESGWGGFSDAAGAFIGSGGGLSQYESEPSYQQGVQSTGRRTTPDVSMFADPATGAWIADPYNLDGSNPFEVAGGTSLAAPAFAGLMAMVNQGRASAGEPTLNHSSPTEAQQALYSLPQADYHVITSGSNGYTAQAGYNLVTGLGTPIAGRFVSDLVNDQGPSTSYPGPKVSALQDATLSGTRSGGGGTNAFNVITGGDIGLGHAQSANAGLATDGPTATVMSGHSATATPPSALGSEGGHASQAATSPTTPWGTIYGPTAGIAPATATASIAPNAIGHAGPAQAWATAQAVAGMAIARPGSDGSMTARTAGPDLLDQAVSRVSIRPDADLDELARDSALWPQQQLGGITIPVAPFGSVRGVAATTNGVLPTDQPRTPSAFSERLAVLGLAAGLWGGTRVMRSRKRSGDRLGLDRTSPSPRVD